MANILKICQVLNIDADALGDGKIEKKSAFASSTDFSIPGLLPLPKTTKRPLIGTIACGEPVLAEENIEGQVDVPEHIRCDFVLRCKGDSMIGARIQDGDLVYIHQQPEVEPGEIAAVLLDGTEATLKRFYRSGDTITLVAENPAYAPIVVTKDRQFRILGKAVGFTSLIR
ncbi:MAG: repressor LexA [Clostridia bacterium]|nr:repressor LexA [Clostridia bacterium]